MKVGIVGYGNMGRAFALGLSSSVGRENILIYEVNEVKSKEAVEDGFATAQNLYFLAKNSEILLIAVKPKDVKGVLQEIKSELKDKIVVSVAAGLELSFYEDILGKKAKLVRLMPNINVLVRRGTIAFTHNGNLLEEEVENLVRVFSTCGSIYQLSESLFDSFTALAGSSPAFVFSFIDALALAGVREGFSYEEALSIVLDTITGSAELIRVMGGNPNEWSVRVSSPGGTTIEGLAYLERKGFKGTVMRCVEKTTEKARKLKG
ncbi:pyrroline-5-carboxylate reductase [Hydrogenivirga caldilitoris]|uniref:Pyrroline-5-carboxylate reductase n=1 Tax=Hydrogenivirga caldilitoris TaxID=246264 RepID=A0A497XM81_9AQUI|nr:pyrroline-5-carboxylate reductase [Hydrogenivirga caldilitoris]RLJ69908.1 pyrroline-5-carboxylate reductase [Hydrogenivirga caldilitoris]